MASDDVVSREQVIDVLRAVFDPEIPVNVWDLGLIYDLQLQGNDVAIKMTLTAVGCPVGPQIAREIENKLQSVGAEQVSVNFVWSPPWSPARLTEDGKQAMQMLGFPI